MLMSAIEAILPPIEAILARHAANENGGVPCVTGP
jgi:hypothetical protein